MIYMLKECCVYDQNHNKKLDFYNIRNGDLIVRPNGKQYRVVGSSADLGFGIEHAIKDNCSYGLRVVHQFWH